MQTGTQRVTGRQTVKACISHTVVGTMRHSVTGSIRQTVRHTVRQCCSWTQCVVHQRTTRSCCSWTIRQVRTGIIRTHSSGTYSTVRRISVGAADHVPFIQVTNLARTMEKLKAAGLWLVGTSDRATKTIYELDLKGPLGLILGAEEKGMRRLTEENCDFLASIPMSGKVACLNVSVATGVCLFEAVRQRRSV